ncbi:MAG TPA: alkaline phosphatase family protein [Acidimicrobiales bacterium]|nr:alkaline phosphatase family protein [Acidimicrobiales bacterium]
MGGAGGAGGAGRRSGRGAERRNTRPVTRRDLLKGGLALGAAGAAAAGLSSAAGASIEKALSLDAASSNPTLSDIKHVVILMQENRSFDHYYGTLSGVRGYSDPHALPGVFRQAGYEPGVGATSSGYLEPFELQQHFPKDNGDCTNDITHEWGAQHQSWNNGAMDSFVKAHLAADGPKNFATTMGYFAPSELPFYNALADAFTICDGYYCSVFGPTDPNRVMALSGTIDPAGTGGGPVLVTQTLGRVAQYGKFTWETMPEALLDAGVTWKVYNDPTGLTFFNPLPYFKAYTDTTTARGLELADLALARNFPAGFAADVKAGKLPHVSWIHGSIVKCEHPATAPQWGENLVQQILDILTSNPEVWASTLFILNYDENGGFFDHVPPPTPPAGTPGEFLSVSPLPAAADGIAGPIGLGFRVPCLLMSPFTRGGFLASDTFDHTSTLRLMETLFGVTVPNLSAWRRATAGDLSSALALGQPANATKPRLPYASLLEPEVDAEVIANALLGTFADDGIPYPPPTANVIPVQATTPARPAPPH